MLEAANFQQRSMVNATEVEASTVTATEIEPRYFDYVTAGHYCSVSRWSLFRAAKAGYLRRYGSSRSPRFLREESDAWMASGAPTASDIARAG
jgi:hypothetical protein